MKFIMIVASSENGVIGMSDGSIPWHLPDDFRHFKDETYGSPVIMGRTTFDTLPCPLPGRLNVVLTNNEELISRGSTEDVRYVSSMYAAIEEAATMEKEKCFIIGGQKIYEQSFEFVSEISHTVVHTDIDEEDAAYFKIPDHIMNRTRTLSSKHHGIDDKHAHEFTINRLCITGKPDIQNVGLGFELFKNNEGGSLVVYKNLITVSLKTELKPGMRHLLISKGWTNPTPLKWFYNL